MDPEKDLGAHIDCTTLSFRSAPHSAPSHDPPLTVGREGGREERAQYSKILDQLCQFCQAEARAVPVPAESGTALQHTFTNCRLIRDTASEGPAASCQGLGASALAHGNGQGAVSREGSADRPQKDPGKAL